MISLSNRENIFRLELPFLSIHGFLVCAGSTQLFLKMKKEFTMRCEKILERADSRAICVRPVWS